MTDTYKIECFFLNVRKISELTNVVFSPDAYLSLAENSQNRKRWLWKSEQRDKWSFCLKAASMRAA
jgi:hypothetical protein